MADDAPVFEQDSLDKRIINIDFSAWLGSGVNIASAAWVVPTGLTASDDSETSTVATNYFESTDGVTEDEYVVACTITTNESIARKKTQRLVIRIENDS